MFFNKKPPHVGKKKSPRGIGRISISLCKMKCFIYVFRCFYVNRSSIFIEEPHVTYFSLKFILQNLEKVEIKTKIRIVFTSECLWWTRWSLAQCQILPVVSVSISWCEVNQYKFFFVDQRKKPHDDADWNEWRELFDKGFSREGIHKLRWLPWFAIEFDNIRYTLNGKVAL